jgi:hypothetical protein
MRNNFISSFCVLNCASNKLLHEFSSDRCRPVERAEISEDPELRSFMALDCISSENTQVFEICSKGPWELSKLSVLDDRNSRSRKKSHVTVIARRQTSSTHLIDWLSHSSGIERTIIWRSGVNDRCMSQLSRAFASGSCKIRWLHLPRNYISPIGAKSLSSGLCKGCCVLHTLDLADNLVGDQGCKYLAEALGKNPLRLLTVFHTFSQ